MAGNRSLIRGRQIPMVPTDGGVNPGDPCVVGQLPGVSINGQPTINGSKSSSTPQTIDTLGVYTLVVKGANSGGNAAINAGDIIYYATGTTYDSTHTPLSANSGGQLFGVALGKWQAGSTGGYPSGQVVASGALTAIDVRLGGI